jgi:predicted O-methyltransferase YrrM
MSTALELAVAFDYLTVREVGCIKTYVQRMPHFSVGVNIGSGAGTSVLAALEERSDITLYDIDLNLLNASDQYRLAGVEGDGRLIRMEGDSKHLPWTYGQIHYLFVDGDHSEEGIRGDLHEWVPRVAPGGFILLHDFWPYPSDHPQAGIDWWPAVRSAALEMLDDYAVVADVDRIRVYQVRQ